MLNSPYRAGKIMSELLQPISSQDRSNLIGIALMCLGAICMVGLDVTARWLMQTYSLPQMVLLRCVFSIVLILGFAAC